MKLRTTTNSLRIRVRKSDLVILEQEGVVRNEIHFPGGNHFSFSLQKKEGIEAPTGIFSQNDIAIILPEKLATGWVQSDSVGIETYIPLGDKGDLHLLIEKDFSCGHRDKEELHDFFPELNDKGNC